MYINIYMYIYICIYACIYVYIFMSAHAFHLMGARREGGREREEKKDK